MITGRARQQQGAFDQRDDGQGGGVALIAGPPVGSQPVRDRRAPAVERPGRREAHPFAAMDGFGGNRLDRTAVAMVRGQAGREDVDPARDHGLDRRLASKELSQQVRDAPADAVDDRCGQFLLALREMVIQRACLDPSHRKDLVQPGRRIALAAEQGCSGIDEDSATAVGARHPLTILERSLKNTNMRQLMFEEVGKYVWRDASDPEISSPGQAVVRPLVVACCDLDVGVARGRLPVPPGHAVGHEGVAEVVAVGDDVTAVRVGDRVVVPFQISCGQCRECRRGVTGSCAAVPLMATYGMAPISGRDGGGFMADLVLVPYADAMLIPVPDSVDLVAIASLSDNIPDGWRTVGPYRAALADLDAADRRVLVVGGLSIGLYAAAFASAYGLHVDYVDTDQQRLAAAEKLGAAVHDAAKPLRSWEPYPVTVHTSANPSLLPATLRATWPDGTCTDTGAYFQASVDMPLLAMYTRGVQFVTGRVNARAVIPEVIDLLASGCDLAPAVDRVAAWEDAPKVWPTMTGKTVFNRLG
jgi:threonine dehydrogenase-like Zn-dependent dehydrogenase